MTTSSEWVQVSPSDPCPKCGEKRRCTKTSDGSVVKCCNVSEGAFKTTEDDVGPAYYHRLRDDVSRRASKPVAEKPAVDAELVNKVYRSLLSTDQSIDDNHLANLVERGLTKEKALYNGYRSINLQNGQQLAKRLQGWYREDLFKVAGFARWPDGSAKFNFPHIVDENGSRPIQSSLFIPVRSVGGKIASVKIRVDDPDWQGAKYVWLTSSKSGVKANAAVHVPKGVPTSCETVRVTEGELKADVAFALDGCPVISIPGVSSHGKALAVLKELGAKEVLIAFDADCWTNRDVAKSLWKLFQSLTAEGYNVVIEHWSIEDGKGIDDLLVGGKIPNAAAGDEAKSLLSEILRSAGVDEPDLHQADEADVPKFDILPAGTRVKCGDRDNIGDVVHDDGGDTVEIHFVSPEGNHATREIPRTELKHLDGRPVIKPPMRLKILTASQLQATFTELRRPVIDEILRIGEVMNVISASKFGKSWLVLGMALSVACGLKWLGRFGTRRGKVLLVDNELHPETLSSRLTRVAMAMGLDPADYGENLQIITLRGGLMDLPALAEQLMLLDPGSYDLIVLDAWYRLQPAGSDENSNADVTALYNLLDSIAHQIGCAFACVHHSTKGAQGDKSVTDVGSGAGAMARAADSHMVMREHEQPGAVAVEAAVRSWAPLQAFCMRYEFPLWSVDEYLNPADVKKSRPSRKPKTEGEGGDSSSRPSREDKAQQKADEERSRLLAELRLHADGTTQSVLRTKCRLSGSRCSDLMDAFEADGVVRKFQTKKGRQNVDMYVLADVGQVGQVGQNAIPSNSSNLAGVQRVDRLDRLDSPPLGGDPIQLSNPTPDVVQPSNSEKPSNLLPFDDLPDMDVH